MGAGVLAVDPALLEAIAKRVGTPVYVYSANLIRAQYHALDDALKDISHRICLGCHIPLRPMAGDPPPERHSSL